MGRVRGKRSSIRTAGAALTATHPSLRHVRCNHPPVCRLCARGDCRNAERSMRGEKKELFHFHSMAMVVSAVSATEKDSTRRAAPTSFIPWMPPWVALPLPDAGSSRLYRGRQPVLRLRAIASPLRTEQPNDQRTAVESQKERRKEREGKKVFQKIPRRKKAAGVAEASPPPLPRKSGRKEKECFTF